MSMCVCCTLVVVTSQLFVQTTDTAVVRVPAAGNYAPPVSEDLRGLEAAETARRMLQTPAR